MAAMTVANNLTFGLRSQRLSDHDIAQRLNHALDVTRLAPTGIATPANCPADSSSVSPSRAALLRVRR